MPTRLLVAARVALLIALAGVTFLSLGPRIPGGPEGSDKLGHLVAYFVLAFLMVLSIWRSPSRLARVVLVALSAVAYGMVMEALQHVVGRQFELMDMVANAVGAVSGTAVGVAARRWIVRRVAPP